MCGTPRSSRTPRRSATRPAVITWCEGTGCGWKPRATVHLYGFSYGGLLGQAPALDHPALLRSLIIPNSLHSPDLWQANPAADRSGGLDRRSGFWGGERGGPGAGPRAAGNDVGEA